MAVGGGGVEEGVAVGVLGGGEPLRGAEEREECGGIIGGEDEGVGSAHGGVFGENVKHVRSLLSVT